MGKYEELLERVRISYINYKKELEVIVDKHSSAACIIKGAICALESQFPELRENEDERIGKEIIEYLKLVDKGEDDYAHSMISRWIAWLEKQKEQKSVMIQWTGKNLKDVIDFTGKSPKFGEWFKSWEDFENYVHSHDDILKLFCEDGSHYEVPVGAWIVKTPDGYNIPSRFRFVQKSAEWNEEDEVLRVRTINHLETLNYHGISGKEIRESINWLKFLRPQPKAEWSEEDEKMLHIIITDVNYAQKNFSDSKLTSYDKKISWLKSLSPRHHWKPTYEQLEGLRGAIIALPDDCPRIKSEMQSLYNDLLKEIEKQ